MFSGGNPYRNVTTIDQMDGTQRIVLTVFLLLVIGFGVLYGWGGFQESRTDAALRADGKHTTGVVANRIVGSDPSSSSAYTLRVGYQVGQIRTSHDFYVTREAFNASYSSPRVELIYDPADPLTVMLANGGEANSGDNSLLIGSLISLGGLLLIAAAWLYWIRFAGSPQSSDAG